MSSILGQDAPFASCERIDSSLGDFSEIRGSAGASPVFHFLARHSRGPSA